MDRHGLRPRDDEEKVFSQLLHPQALPGGGVLGLMPEQGIRNLLGASLPDPSAASGIPRAELYLVLTEPNACARLGSCSCVLVGKRS